jgi:predicted dehydrogenase
MKILQIGLGNMGANHLRVLNVLNGIDEITIFDKDSLKTKFYSDLYNIKGIESLSEIKDNFFDGILIASPAFTHSDIFKQIASNSKNIFIEKPVGISMLEKREIKKIADNNKINVQIGFIERFNPVVQELKKIIEDQEVLIADIQRTNKLSSRITDVGVTEDLMIHDIDIMNFLFGKNNMMFSHKIQDGSHTGMVSASFIDHNNGHVRILASRMTEKKIRKIHVSTKDFYIEGDLANKTLNLYKQSNILNDGAHKIVSVKEEIALSREEPLNQELLAFISNINVSNSTSVPTLDCSLKCQKIIDLIENKENE